MLIRNNRKLFNWLEDRRHRLLSYPEEAVPKDREAVFAGPPRASAIPRTLVQTFRSRKTVRPIRSAILRWQEMNPEFAYRYFDDADAREFIGDEYPADVLAAFDSLRPGAFRADLWRYCYVARSGGVYVDIRMEPLVALRTILGFSDETPPQFVGVIDRPEVGPGFLYNAFFAATADHPFVVGALERALDQIARRNFGRNALDITGPGCFGAAVNVCLDQNSAAPFTRGDSSHEAVGTFRLLTHEDAPYHRSIVALQELPCIRTKCIHGPMSNADRKSVEPSYSDLYKRRMVFR